MSYFKAEMLQIRFCWGSATDPAGKLTALPPNLLAGFKGSISKGRGGEGRWGQGRREKAERKGKGEEGEGRGWEGKGEVRGLPHTHVHIISGYATGGKYF